MAAALIFGVAVAGVLATTGLIGKQGQGEATVEPLPMQSEAANGGRDANSAIAAARLGYPTFATKNTTRVGGARPIDNAAAVALATFPSSGDSPNPEAVTLVPSESWPVAIAAAALAAPPVSAPILIAEPDGIGEVTEKALQALAPKGGPNTAGSQLFAVGAVPEPEGLVARAVGGDSAAGIAASLARLRQQLTGKEPEAFVLIGETEPGYAMPAAAWAARSGDPILISETNRLPEETTKLLASHAGVPVYILGPESVISKRVERQLGRDGRPVTRIAGGDPVANAIEFARFSDGRFGWNINDPGHGLVVAADTDPLNAAAAAALSAAGTWGPLLLTSDPEIVPGVLRSYLLDIKPGYRDDPTRAVYNHIWIVGDQEAISVGQQASLDQLAELERIGGEQPPQTTPPAGDESANPGASGNNQEGDASRPEKSSDKKGQ